GAMRSIEPGISRFRVRLRRPGMTAHNNAQLSCPTGARSKIVSIRLRKNISIFQKWKSVYGLRHPAPFRGAYRDRHDTWGGDAVDANAPTDERRRLRTAKSCGPGAPMQALSWRRCLCIAPATVANKLVHRGEREVSRKTTAQGMPDCSG